MLSLFSGVFCVSGVEVLALALSPSCVLLSPSLSSAMGPPSAARSSGCCSLYLELLHHVPSVDVAGHRREFGAREVIGLVYRDAGYHRELSRSVYCWRARCSALCSQRSLAAAALSCAFVGAVVLCPRELMRSFGFWNSGGAKNGDGVKAEGILGSSSWRQKDSGHGASANRTLWAGVLWTAMAGVFLFRALDRLKVVCWGARR